MESMRSATSKRRGRRPRGLHRLIALVLLALLAALSQATLAEASECATRAMYMVAHEDDSLLFQSPDLLGDIRSGRCVRTVFLTAGDAGLGEGFWRAREQGAEAAYARMAGVADPEAWTESTEMVNGHSIALSTMNEDPRISLLFMRLPDGGYPAGLGNPAHGNQSLMQLWNDGNEATPAKSTIEAVDGSTSYEYEDLVETLTDIMSAYEPRWIAAQNYTGHFPVGPEEPIDHPDHVATAKFVREAQRAYAAPHQLIGYEDYETEYEEDENVLEPVLAEKVDAFAAYAEHDTSCDKGESCEELYEDWLARQYEAASETHGFVANAGYSQTVDSGEAVSLDGSRSSVEEGAGAFAYEWLQIAGPAVALDDAGAVAPSFVAPPAAASLSFSLTVSDGSETSVADVVSIAVEGPDPTPTAVAGAAQTVESGASAALDGSGSVNPYLQPLGHEWRQVAGPAVDLSGGGTAAPSFVAPSGPASLEFSLVVSNAAGPSAPAFVTISVLPEEESPSADPPPAPTGTPASGGAREPGGSRASVPRLLRRRIGLAVPRRGRVRKVVWVRGGVGRVWCTGRLPRGARRRVAGRRRVVIEATPAVRKPGRYRLHVHALTQGRVVTRTLIVRLVRRHRG